MKTTKIFAVCFLFLSSLAGCDLTNLNDNPNEPDDTVDYNFNDPQLASALRRGILMEGDVEQRYKSLQLDFYSHVGDGGAFSPRLYEMRDDWNELIYKHIQSIVADLNIVITQYTELYGDQYKHSIGMAKIWRVFIHATGADFFGPIPFSPYKDPVMNPPYVSLEDTYNEFFTELEDAVRMLSEESQKPIFMSPTSDVLYGNDPKLWIKFANSLRLRYALRLSEVNPEKCAAEAQKAIAAGTFESKADDAFITPKGDGSWGNNYNYKMFQIDWSTAINMTSSMEKILSGIGGIDFPTDVFNKRSALKGNTVTVTNVHPKKADPRATKMFDPGFEAGNWKGLPIGLPGPEYTSSTKNTHAEFGYLIKNGSVLLGRPYDLFLYEEVCFLKSEAAYRGFVTGIDAKAEYEKGVRASFEKWEVSDKVDEYLASTEKNLAGTSAKFDDQVGDGNTALEKIITQKYLAAFPDIAMESWCDKRRLNLPRFDVLIQRYELLYDNNNRDFKDPKNFIKRVQYPEQEKKINNEEYNKGVELLGGPDNVATPLWWDLNKNYCTSGQ